MIHRIVITPSSDSNKAPRHNSRGALYDVSYNGIIIVTASTEPCLAAARVLKARGLKGRIEMWDNVLPYCRVHTDIEKAAGLTIEEGERQPRLRRYVSRGGGMAKYGDFASGSIPVAQTGESRPTDSPARPQTKYWRGL